MMDESARIGCGSGSGGATWGNEAGSTRVVGPVPAGREGLCDHSLCQFYCRGRLLSYLLPVLSALAACAPAAPARRHRDPRLCPRVSAEPDEGLFPPAAHAAPRGELEDSCCDSSSLDDHSCVLPRAADVHTVVAKVEVVRELHVIQVGAARESRLVEQVELQLHYCGARPRAEQVGEASAVRSKDQVRPVEHRALRREEARIGRIWGRDGAEIGLYLLIHAHAHVTCTLREPLKSSRVRSHLEPVCRRRVRAMALSCRQAQTLRPRLRSATPAHAARRGCAPKRQLGR